VKLDPDHIKRQIDALRRDHPDVFDDVDYAADVLEGQTDLHAFMDTAAEIVADAEAAADAIKSRQTELGERKARYERKAEALRGVMLSVLEASGQTKVTLPSATISVRSTPPKAQITDEAAVPPSYWRVKREIDKAAVVAALKNGEAVDGAVLTNGGQTLTIRRT
jgi:phage host-nuclease inhibitor protein Gam